MRKFFRDNGLSTDLLSLVGVFLIGEAVCGWLDDEGISASTVSRRRGSQRIWSERIFPSRQ